MKIKFRREYLLFLILLYLIFLLFQIKPKKAEWEKKPLPINPQEIREVTRYTKDFSFTETKDEKTIFEIYAKEVLAQKDTLLSLKDVLITFYVKEGKLLINCKNAKFDIEKKNASVSGNVMIKLPNGLNFWTEDLNYQHNNGTLEGPILLNLDYKNFIGKCSSIKINIFSEIFTLENLELQSYNSFILIPSLEGNIKKSSFFSKSNTYLFYEKNILTFKEFNINFSEEKIFINGKCFSGNFFDFKKYTYFSENFEGEFLSKNFQPLIFKFSNNIELISSKENIKIKAETAILYFDYGKPLSFHFSNSIEIENNEDRIYCDVINAYFKEDKLDNVFFGDYVILCFNGWYITCDNMNYLPENEMVLLGGKVISSKGYLKAKSSWMKIFQRGEKIFFGGGVEIEEMDKGMHIKAKDCTFEEKIKKINFRENVIAWTKDYTLKSKRLEMIENIITASNNAELSGLKDGEVFSLKADEIKIKQREEKLEALGSVEFEWENYIMEGYFLQIFRNENKIEKFLLTDLINFFTFDKKQKGSGELLEIYPNKNLLILEGCPAALEDFAEGKIEASTLFILKEPPEIFVIDDKKGKIVYKKNN